MKLKILTFLLIGVILCSSWTYRPLVEGEIKLPDAPKTHLKQKRNIYIPPTGKVLRIAERVSNETGISQEIISRIMYFESSYNQKEEPKNTNGTRDIGIFQINSTHLKEAKKLGLNLRDMDDNAEFAIRLIKQHPDLRDWKASKHNWST
jgi:hypothetical protein